MRFLLLFVCLQAGTMMTSGRFVHGQVLNFDHLTLQDGLSESTVLTIAQDKEGFMWFGTREGLNRYDARSITIFRHQPEDPSSLSDNFIYSLLSDRTGRLWVGTRNGLNLFDSRTEAFTKFVLDPRNSHSISDNTATCLLQDQDGRIWVGTRAGLNLLVEGDSISFLRFINSRGHQNSLMNDDIHAIFQDREGIIWIGTSGSFSRLDYKGPENYSFRSFQLSHFDGRREKNNSVNSFSEDAYGRLLIGTERSGLLFMNKQTFEVTNPLPESGPSTMAIRSILSDPSGNFWIGTIGGLFISNHDFTVVKRYRNVDDNPTSVSDNSIRSIFYDRDGSYWIGTFHGGVNIHSPLSKQFRHLSPRLSGEKITIKVASAITTDPQRNFWIGTDGNGLFFIDPQSNVKAHFRHHANSNSLSHDNVKCLLLDDDKGLWIGTIKGLDYYDFRLRRFIHFRNDSANRSGLPDDVIYDIVKDKSGNLWVATYFGGLARIDGERRVVENIYSFDPNNPRSLSSQTVTCLETDSKNSLWVGTAAGINKQLPDGSFLRIPIGHERKSYPSELYILTIFEDSRNQLWIGTRGEGLYLLDADGNTMQQFSLDDGLPGNSVYGVQEDSNGYLWISTEHGLSRFSPETSTFNVYNRSDGLLCQEFNFNSYHRDRNGNFYFGGYNGVAWFHPDSIYENRIVPAVRFTDVKLFNRKLKPGDGTGVMQSDGNGEATLHLRHNQNIFSIEFAVLNFINSSKNQFAYKLEGFEDDWNYVREPVATYMNLAPGTYTLMVRGANNDSFWNETPRTLSIVVFPPPWKTWWAYTCYCLAFLLLLFGWAQLNRKQLTLRHELQLEHIEMQKQEELHRAKLNFFTNVAHEIRTPVTLIASPIEHLLENQAQNTDLKKELTLIKNNSDRLMRLLNQLLDFQKQETGNVILKAGNGNIVSFLKGIIDSFREYAHSRRVSLHLDHSVDKIDLWFDKEELSKVFFNLLANALKFTPGGGEINVSVLASGNDGSAGDSDDGGFVRIVVQDNGLGIAPDQLDKIFHRFHQAENTGIRDAGFGIGLALSKGIIDLHHGSIEVVSGEATETETGFTQFTIMLRTGNSHFDASQILHDSHDSFTYRHDDEIRISSNDEKHGGERSLILIVEDSEEIRNYMRDVLVGVYDVLESVNGSEAVAIAVERLPDLIVSDIMMPMMNGIELVSRLKKDPRTNHIPVILLTARGTINHQIEGLEIGADDYLTKPFNMNLLLVRIKNHLATREKLKERYSRMVRLQPNDMEIRDPDDQFLQRLMQILEDNMKDAEFNVSGLAREIGMSRPVLFRKTKMLTGLSVIDLLRNVRLKKAEMLLKQRKLNISEVAFSVGFSDPKYFSKAFRNHFGKSPSQFIDELS